MSLTIPSLLGGPRTDVFDPFSVWDLSDEFFNSALANTMSSSSSVREASAIANARVDWKETPEAHVKVEVEEGRVLQISGERSKEQEEKNDKWHRVERSSGKFLRRFTLPETAKMDQVKASMENGVLTVTVPKVEDKKPEVKAIEISG
ncbi:hypothetical protein ES319_D07G108700v1 [Gossypium barbadense]|uniref:SHSP domain-containing protein n=1 Tax=Gossypium barbadense TaxID=3634 RepID=A0A5J5QPG8_GOSBA|nr:hypothetical protein ES319_D07G108700v1 [Gossypium barbadense]